MRIGIVAGETSGDLLGAGLIAALREKHPSMRFEGICGPRMIQAGARSMFDMDSISIMGVDDLLHSVGKILRIRKGLLHHFIEQPPALFIGVDVPDFNLSLEAKLRAQGINTVHYVSPTVWAWRGYRIRKIRRAVGHMLAMFPFEAEFYRERGIPVTFVGHPVADEIDPDPDIPAMRRNLGISAARVVALLPGSRLSEVKRLGRPFLHTASRLAARYPDLEFVMPLASTEIESRIRAICAEDGAAPPHLILVQGRSREVLACADVALLASGTAALESALVGTPMVVAYRVSPLTALLVRMSARVEHFSMPNNLLPDPVVPELLQGAANVENMTREVSRFLDDDELCQQTRRQFSGILNTLRVGANHRAAEAVARIIGAAGCSA